MRPLGTCGHPGKSLVIAHAQFSVISTGHLLLYLFLQVLFHYDVLVIYTRGSLIVALATTL